MFSHSAFFNNFRVPSVTPAGESTSLVILPSCCFSLLVHYWSLPALISSLLSPYHRPVNPTTPTSASLRAELSERSSCQVQVAVTWTGGKAERGVCVCRCVYQGMPSASILGNMPQWCRKRLNLTSWPTNSIPEKIQTYFLGSLTIQTVLWMVMITEHIK